VDARFEQRIDESGRAGKVGLIRRNDVPAGIPTSRVPEILIEVFAVDSSGTALCRSRGLTAPVPLHCRVHLLYLARQDGPAVLAPLRNRGLPHQIDLIEKDFAVPGSQIEDRPIGGDGILDRLPEVPSL